jgi:tetratricopeptide (TPR) repeat protein
MISANMEAIGTLLVVALAISPFQEAEEARTKAFREGIQLFQAGRIDEAEAAFLAVIAATPEDGPSRVQLSRIYARTGREQDAVRVLEDGLRYRPNGIGLLNELGALLLAEGRASDAEGRFREALAIEPGNPRTAMGLARSLAARGDPAAGAAVLETALATSPDIGELQFLLGSLQVRLAKYPEALEALAKARDLGVESPGVDVYRALALEALGRRDEAESTLRSVLQRTPDAPEARKQLGLLLAETRPGEALEHLSRALEALPGDLPALETAGLLAVTLNRDPQAIELLSRAVALAPDRARLWLALGETHYRRAESDEARDAFERALGAKPSARESEAAHFYLGEIAFAARRFEQAAEQYRQSSSIDSRRGLAESLSKLGRGDEAASVVAEALAASEDAPTKASMLGLAAKLHLDRGEDEAALEALSESRTLDPNRAETSYLLGTLLARLGRTAEARDELERFRSLKAFDEEKERLQVPLLERPFEAASYRPLIDLYVKAGRISEARPLIEKALLLAPGDPELVDLERRAR